MQASKSNQIEVVMVEASIVRYVQYVRALGYSRGD
jgi:hypothetical protein